MATIWITAIAALIYPSKKPGNPSYSVRSADSTRTRRRTRCSELSAVDDRLPDHDQWFLDNSRKFENQNRY